MKIEVDPAKSARNKAPERTDPENPEWTADDFKRAQPFDALPKALQKKLGAEAVRAWTRRRFPSVCA